MSFKCRWIYCAFIGATLAASEAAAQHTVKVIGRDSATVVTEWIALEDVAEVQGASAAEDEAVIALRKIKLFRSPAPGATAQHRADDVLRRLQDEGVDLTQIGYRFQREITVRRAGRTLRMEEISDAIEEYLAGLNENYELENVRYRQPVSVAPGSLSLSVSRPKGADIGTVPFQLTATTGRGDPQKFEIVADVELMTSVPVAQRDLGRGEQVREGDITFARKRSSDLPQDAITDIQELTGLRLKSAQREGEPFRRTRLEVPPIITTGELVTLRYKTRLFEATAKGVALESGATGKEIRIRNQDSKKIVVGRVLEPGLVQVGP